MIGNLGANVGRAKVFCYTLCLLKCAHAHVQPSPFANAVNLKNSSEDCETVQYVLGIDVEQSGSFAVTGDAPLTRHKK